jgi:hypothetical protein
MAPGTQFVEPMLALAVAKLPEGPSWSYELKFDDYRTIGLKTNGVRSGIWAGWLTKEGIQTSASGGINSAVHSFITNLGGLNEQVPISFGIGNGGFSNGSDLGGKRGG